MSTFVVRGDAQRAARPEPLSSRRAAPRKLAAAVLTVGLAAGGWWFLAPPSLGGTTAVAIVDGTSMLPHFQRNDVVLLRASDHYGVGDVVAYRSHFLHRVVLHRIVAVSHGRYTFKGDNNTWTDPERPTRRDLIGKQWVVLGRVGHVAGRLRTPPVLAALAGLIVLAFGLGRPRRGTPTER